MSSKQQRDAWLQRKALAHYDTLIEIGEFLVRINPKGIADRFKFEVVFGTSWDGEFCSYCDTYYTDDGCFEDCPLGKNESCCNGLWSKLSTSKTWESWLAYARKIRQYIEKHGIPTHKV